MFPAGETSIEALFDCPASAGFSHEGLEADDFAPYPRWLGPGAKRDPHRFMELSIMAQAVARDGPSETYEVEEQDEEKREHAERLCCRGLVSGGRAGELRADGGGDRRPRSAGRLGGGDHRGEC